MREYYFDYGQLADMQVAVYHKNWRMMKQILRDIEMRDYKLRLDRAVRSVGEVYIKGDNT